MGKLVTDPQIVQATFNGHLFRPGLEEGEVLPHPLLQTTVINMLRAISIYKTWIAWHFGAIQKR